MNALLDRVLCTREQADERLGICAGCPELGRLLPNVCGVCSCFMPAKACLRASSCPEGHWAELPYKTPEASA